MQQDLRYQGRITLQPSKEKRLALLEKKVDHLRRNLQELASTANLIAIHLAILKEEIQEKDSEEARKVRDM